jgi:hypothetical protein
MSLDEAIRQLKMMEKKVDEWKQYMREEFGYED